ncbi:MAG: hypothetical protein AB7I41_12290 [Candidatus Sericytochromatia bacterium]
MGTSSLFIRSFSVWTLLVILLLSCSAPLPVNSVSPTNPQAFQIQALKSRSRVPRDIW